MVRNWYQPTVYHHGECCLLDENKIIVAIYIEHIDVFTAVKGTFGRRDNQVRILLAFNALISVTSSPNKVSLDWYITLNPAVLGAGVRCLSSLFTTPWAT
jgi:hypothetical protein